MKIVLVFDKEPAEYDDENEDECGRYRDNFYSFTR